MNARSPRIIRWLWRARLLVVALAAADFIAMWIHDSRIEWESIDYHGYYADTLYAFVLLLASLCLLSDRIWILTGAALLSMHTFYVHLFRPLRGISNAHDVSILSADAWRRWSYNFRFQPQYVLHLTVASLVLLTALILIGKSARRW